MLGAAHRAVQVHVEISDDSRTAFEAVLRESPLIQVASQVYALVRVLGLDVIQSKLQAKVSATLFVLELASDHVSSQARMHAVFLQYGPTLQAIEGP